MAPKPRPRVSSITSKDVFSKEEIDAKAMPPPPEPSRPMSILEPEMNALNGCLKGAVVKTGQVFRFYADTKKLGIQRHSPEPPKSLTSSLGRDIEKYDQLCDAIESHLLQAISILQRDLHREEQRERDAQRAATSTATLKGSTDSIEGHTVSEPSSSPTISTTPLGRGRQSTISLSSLNRPSFPLKLDLSATSLRLSAEETSFLNSSGLHSPVTLAPKSARPPDFPDLMAAFVSAEAASRPVDIDLTSLPDTQSDSNMDMNIGTADKPIDIDIDSMDIDINAMNDLFGDSGGENNSNADSNVDDLFSPVMADGNKESSNNTAEEEKFLNSLGVGGDEQSKDDLFSETSQTLEVPDDSQTAPSPNTLLASLSAGVPAEPSQDAQFHIDGLDLDFFSSQDQESGMTLMHELLGMDSTEPKGEGSNSMV